MKALRMPTGRNGINPVRKAALQEREAENFNHSKPNVRVMLMPIKLAAMACMFVKPLFSSQNPVMNAAGMKPIKYPPVGPNKIPSPLVKLEKTGRPMVPRPQ